MGASHYHFRVTSTYTLNETAAALINVAGSLTGAFGLAGLEQGTAVLSRHDGDGLIFLTHGDQTYYTLDTPETRKRLNDAATVKRLAEYMHKTQVDAFREAHKL